MDKNLTANRKQEIAYKITEFWHTIEFLSQDNFPQESKNDRKKVNKEKEALVHGKVFKPEERLTFFYKLTQGTDLEEIIKEDNSIFLRHPVLGSEYHICVGKIRRRDCAEKLNEYLKIDKEEIEKDERELAAFGLKIADKDVYVPDSFNFSPLLWGIGLIKQYGVEAQNIITIERYKEDLEKYEEILREADIITNDILETILEELNGNLIFSAIEKTCQYEGAFIYYRYIDDKTCEELDAQNEDLSDLSHSFYNDDLLMVKNRIKSGKFGQHDKMQNNVIDYIVSAYESNGIEDTNDEISDLFEKVDIKNDQVELTKWLHGNKLPLGKWPSKFVPALMQQVAVNIEMAKKDSLNQIFSVNGPPGTGKTTLLKEIIATNLIERAKLLVKYDTPDDAFTECQFRDGNFKNNGYDKYYYRYYKFKNKKISDYSMLVASCNNAAVENITKDLPNMTDLCNGLKCERGKDSQQQIEGLMEIEGLFSLDKTDRLEVYSRKDRETKSWNKEELPDIYFSWFAHRLLTNDVEGVEPFREWGLISAPLGKKSNIRNYYKHVLIPLINDFLKTNAKREKRLEKFKSFSREFKKQLKNTEGIREKLIEYSSLKDNCEIERTKIDENNLEINHQIREIEKKIDIIHKKDNLTAKEIIQFEREYDKINDSILTAESDNKNLELLIQECDQNIDEISQKIMNLEDNLKFIDHIYIFLKRKTERVSRIYEMKENKKVEKDRLEATEIKKYKVELEISNLRTELKKREDKSSELMQYRAELLDQIQKKNHEIELLNRKINKNQEIKKRINKDFEAKTEELKKSITVLDEEFWLSFTSEDQEHSTKAQISNPWINDEFNRAREKLFYLALQVHKEFVLSSTACRDNLINLVMMWQNKTFTDPDFVSYSKRDREQAFPELLNTLFLFTPVLSTTFASVQVFLNDIKEPGKIGNLIIDEAGQAPPHMAIGALYRCKKAIIVGDPKQVEPVVTDDADFIKRAFYNEIIQPYIDKTLSVQELADNINPYGTCLQDGDAYKWVGCPLIVHRRCISPMFDISNVLSYGNSMKIKTAPPKADISKKFLYDKSIWFDIKGKELNPAGKNHFVINQGQKACEMIKDSFQKYGGKPDLYVISPFVTVIKEIKEMIKADTNLDEFRGEVEEWCDQNCGTVHKFQGKEAAEVIFLLGCDSGAKGAVNWVKSNIVNVAVTRAKYRLYVIGDVSVWELSKYFQVLRKYL